MARFSIDSTINALYGGLNLVGTTGGVISGVSPVNSFEREVPPASVFTAEKTHIGTSSNSFDLQFSTDMQSKIDLGLMYSNGRRYQYINFKAGTTGCTEIVPSETIILRDINGNTYAKNLGEQTIIKAYVGNSLAIFPLPNQDVPSCIPPLRSKVEQIQINNTC